MTVSNDGSEPYSLGTTTIVWTATDGSGNTASCSQFVTVQTMKIQRLPVRVM